MATTTITKFAHLQIPLKEVQEATNNFHDDNIIGRGGLGRIYKGRLIRSGKQIKTAALRLDSKQRDRDIEFWTEISMLSDLQHTNIVSLIGFCNEKDEKIIITQHSAKGSLTEHLSSPNLTWTQRLKICVGMARALSYLHHDMGRGYAVLHLNINSSTILLDENLEPKLSGFKVSVKQPLNRMDRVFLSEPFGTLGYVDPEIEKTKGVTHKSDIYSFGVVLFEILCGRRACIKNEANRFLNRLAIYHYENQTLQEIIHPELRNQVSPNSLRIYSTTAYSCLEKERVNRPDILTIVDKLEKALKQALKFQPHFENNLENLKYQLSDIKLATHNFSNTYRVSSNRYYTRYKVATDNFDRVKPSSIEEKSKSELPKRHNVVVIKRFLPVDDEQDEELFFTELKMLTSVKHHNIVNLLGFCVEGFDMVLVTENFSNGHLMDYLGNATAMCALTWEKRLKICIDISRALNYIHFEMGDKKVIIHNNLNNTKIGLNENWEVKIEDFEWAIFMPPNQEESLYENQIFSSWCIVDPEYEEENRESDMYSFGVILLEILYGREASDQIYIKKGWKGLAQMVRERFKTERPEDMIDDMLKEKNDETTCFPNTGADADSLKTFLKVAHRCMAKFQKRSPTTMKVVLKKLEKALSIQEQVQQLDEDQVAEELEIEIHEIPEEQVQQLENDHQNIDKHEIASREIAVKLEHLKIPLLDIKLATDNFSGGYIISESSNCTFYRAELDHFDRKKHSPIKRKNKGKLPKRHSTVIIKRYPFGDPILGEEEYYTEVQMLTRINHPNIVTLLGCCVEDSEMILVIENVNNGCLDGYIGVVEFMRVLTWEKRLKICIDVAHALEYIHYGIKGRNIIINRDICSMAIMLDENWVAKIVDFWFSAFVPRNTEHEATFSKTTFCHASYADPVFKKTRELRRELDVYSFGVVLFEILSGRNAYDPIFKNENDKGLAHVARRRYSTRTVEDIIDPIIIEETRENNFVLNRGPNKDSLHIFIEIAYKCVAETQAKRPTMEVVVKELEKALLFQKNNKDNPIFSIEDVKVATRNFHTVNCIGRGGFGRVFKGTLQGGDGFKTIVAKQLDTKLGQGEQEFLTELQILLEYKHENVIGLIGYCDEQDEKIILFEYASRGSLDRYLNNASLTWVKRLNICVDVARALEYLHAGDGKQARVIHRDIKTANILLTHEWKAKLADFGLSLISPLSQETDYVIDHACGTQGYLDPLYRNLGFLTIESDIYSLGVVLLEILCGRSTFENQKLEGHYLPEFIKKNFEERKYEDVVFEQISEQIAPKSLTTFLEIAYQCLHHEREKRPTAKKVLMELKIALELQVSFTKACSGH